MYVKTYIPGRYRYITFEVWTGNLLIVIDSLLLVGSVSSRLYWQLMNILSYLSFHCIQLHLLCLVTYSYYCQPHTNRAPQQFLFPRLCFHSIHHNHDSAWNSNLDPCIPMGIDSQQNLETLVLHLWSQGKKTSRGVQIYNLTFHAIRFDTLWCPRQDQCCMVQHPPPMYMLGNTLHNNVVLENL